MDETVDELMNNLPNHHEDNDSFVCSSYYPKNGGNYMAKGEKKDCNCEVKYHREVLIKAIQAERQKRNEVVDNFIEPVAKAIYSQMECLDPRGKPEWVENGNSLKQDEARKLARQALTPPTPLTNDKD